MKKNLDISEKPYFEKIIKNNKPKSEKGRLDKKRQKQRLNNNY